jgi:hypothetical protein
MKIDPVAYDLLNAHKVLGIAVSSLEKAVAGCHQRGTCRRKAYMAIAHAKESLAQTEELAHLAATGEWK